MNLGIICDNTSINILHIQLILRTAGYYRILYMSLVKTLSLNNNIIQIVIAQLSILETESISIIVKLKNDIRICYASFNLHQDIIEVAICSRLPTEQNSVFHFKPCGTWITIRQTRTFKVKPFICINLGVQSSIKIKFTFLHSIFCISFGSNHKANLITCREYKGTFLSFLGSAIAKIETGIASSLSEHIILIANKMIT